MDAPEHEYELAASHFKNYNKLSGCINIRKFLKQMSGKTFLEGFSSLFECPFSNLPCDAKS